jgi:hypothetical protein
MARSMACSGGTAHARVRGAGRPCAPHEWQQRALEHGKRRSHRRSKERVRPRVRARWLGVARAGGQRQRIVPDIPLSPSNRHLRRGWAPALAVQSHTT